MIQGIAMSSIMDAMTSGTTASPGVTENIVAINRRGINLSTAPTFAVAMIGRSYGTDAM